jgi:hypothetical protein
MRARTSASMPTPASLITNETYDSGGVSRRSSRSLFSSIFSVLEPERFIGRRSSAELTAQTKSASEAWGKRSSPDDSALYHAFIRSNVTGWTVSVGAPRGVIDGSLLRGEALLASGGGDISPSRLLRSAGDRQPYSRPNRKACRFGRRHPTRRGYRLEGFSSARGADGSQKLDTTGQEKCSVRDRIFTG